MEDLQVFNEAVFLEWMQKLKAEGRSEILGCLLLNEPCEIIGLCKDQLGEVLYLISFVHTKTEVYTPQWV